LKLIVELRLLLYGDSKSTGSDGGCVSTTFLSITTIEDAEADADADEKEDDEDDVHLRPLKQ
jgi:hypothetical protein